MAAGEEIDAQISRENARKGAMKANKKKPKSNMNTYIAIGIFGGIMAIVIGILIFNPEVPLHLTPAVDSTFIESQNALKLGYTLKENTYFKDWNLKDVTQASQTYISQQAKTLTPCQTYLNEGGLVPDHYDVREEFPHCMSDIYVQGNCSSSYALAVASSLSERFCIHSQGAVLVNLSGQDLVSCDKKNNGCTQGNIDSVWNYIRDVGLVESKVFPYTSKDLTAPGCPEKLEDATFKVSEFCASATEAALMREIKKNGPVVGIMQVFTDFLVYGGGVYRPHIAATKVKGAHAVEVLGWGTDENQQPYWIIKNSWGPEWGEKGYAKIARNVKEISLEDFVVTGTPFISTESAKPTGIPVEVEDIEDLNAQKKDEPEIVKIEEKPKTETKASQ
ncbi:unnamed protein product [Blepharisma stoltei]|uniref:Peptidase C1A papain C-terminal domain-containing protein n=1 Tax=Blepharisma stoltei TaxID=1481888 RepID=A0AAU9JB82_9CILI|nr:unnamed protein product [Blepharisma stoltei]